MPAKTIFVLSPHTDDGELGCGASISRFIEEGNTVIHVVFSLCRDSLPAGLAPDTLATEAKNANAVLGVKEENLLLLDYPVRRFSESRQSILDEMIRLQKQYKPVYVFIPSSTDIHQDHGVIHTEAIRAFKHCTIYGYEMPWNNYSFSGTSFVAVDETNIIKKVAALSTYQSQQHRKYMQPDFITSLAKVRGVQAGVLYAECFETIRTIQ